MTAEQTVKEIIKIQVKNDIAKERRLDNYCKQSVMKSKKLGGYR